MDLGELSEAGSDNCEALAPARPFPTDDAGEPSLSSSADPAAFPERPLPTEDAGAESPSVLTEDAGAFWLSMTSEDAADADGMDASGAGAEFWSVSDDDSLD